MISGTDVGSLVVGVSSCRAAGSERRGTRPSFLYSSIHARVVNRLPLLLSSSDLSPTPPLLLRWMSCWTALSVLPRISCGLFHGDAVFWRDHGTGRATKIRMLPHSPYKDQVEAELAEIETRRRDLSAEIKFANSELRDELNTRVLSCFLEEQSDPALPRGKRTLNHLAPLWIKSGAV